MELSSTFKHIFSPNGNIEKIPAPSRSHISSSRSGNQTWLLLVIPYLSLQNSLPNHKTHIAGKRLSMFVTHGWAPLHAKSYVKGQSPPAGVVRKFGGGASHLIVFQTYEASPKIAFVLLQNGALI
ncbi:hypothetical protein AVEN_50892-1 [Araneus ventricosus]|uniref:Uncharacterized protein n=1 Tax=Araneus ventricosus TaxID=182803 RepID=A0A4Y2FPG3_ARAVE|nr:hypothetical protein AVEN_50892-1 [Araneus ventricosus]